MMGEAKGRWRRPIIVETNYKALTNVLTIWLNLVWVFCWDKMKQVSIAFIMKFWVEHYSFKKIYIYYNIFLTLSKQKLCCLRVFIRCKLWADFYVCIATQYAHKYFPISTIYTRVRVKMSTNLCSILQSSKT